VENQTGKKVKCLRTDNGIDYTNDEFRDFCEQHGIGDISQYARHHSKMVWQKG
jgi:hypothetical protein